MCPERPSRRAQTAIVKIRQREPAEGPEDRNRGNTHMMRDGLPLMQGRAQAAPALRRNDTVILKLSFCALPMGASLGLHAIRGKVDARRGTQDSHSRFPSAREGMTNSNKRSFPGESRDPASCLWTLTFVRETRNRWHKMHVIPRFMRGISSGQGFPGQAGE